MSQNIPYSDQTLSSLSNYIEPLIDDKNKSSKIYGIQNESNIDNIENDEELFSHSKKRSSRKVNPIYNVPQQCNDPNYISGVFWAYMIITVMVALMLALFITSSTNSITKNITNNIIFIIGFIISFIFIFWAIFKSHIHSFNETQKYSFIWIYFIFLSLLLIGFGIYFQTAAFSTAMFFLISSLFLLFIWIWLLWYVDSLSSFLLIFVLFWLIYVVYIFTRYAFFSN